MSEWVAMINIAAREEGKYRAHSGHSANPYKDLPGGGYGCSICGDPVTRNENTRSGWMHRPARRSRSIQPIPVVKGYFHRWHPEHDGQTPIIFEAFGQETGWKRYPVRKRVSRSWLRKLRSEGYTRVSLAVGQYDHIVADFSISELL
jgi:hypothetical protein